MRTTRRTATFAFAALACLAAGIEVRAGIVFESDFDSGLPTEFSGTANSIEGVQGYNGLGPSGNQFSGDLLRNSSTGNPAAKTVLTLTGLPAHPSLHIEFLLAIINSWDGASGPASAGPDFFNIRVDGATVFSQPFGPGGYTPPPGGLLFDGPMNSFGGSHQRAYNMYLEPSLHNIPHTASSVTIEIFASGGGWQGGNDESWAIDNLRVTATPEPASLTIWGSGALALCGLAWWRRRSRRCASVSG